MRSIRKKIRRFLKKEEKEPGHLDQSNQPQHPNHSLSDKTQLLLAFRTITLMLSLIHSSKRITNAKMESTDLRRQLKPLDALAAIAIRQHGIAAATVAKRNDKLGTLEVLAFSDSSCRLPGPADPQTSSPTSNTPGPWSQLFLLALNPRRDRLINDDKEPPGQSSKIVDPETEIPESLKYCKEPDLLKTYLKEVW
jgi:hypothetical protein